MTFIKLLFITILLLGFGIPAYANECDDIRVLKQDTFGAVNQDVFTSMGDDTLASLEESKLIAKLAKGTRVCFLNENFLFYRQKIRLLGNEHKTYWISSSATEKID